MDDEQKKRREKAYDSIIKKAKELKVDIVIDKDIFLQFFDPFDDPRTGEILSYFLNDQLISFKRDINKEEIALCPNCDNILFMTGHMWWHRGKSSSYYFCTKCARSYKCPRRRYSPKYGGELEEIDSPEFMRLQE